jgi:hypothetical protein
MKYDEQCNPRLFLVYIYLQSDHNKTGLPEAGLYLCYIMLNFYK